MTTKLIPAFIGAALLTAPQQDISAPPGSLDLVITNLHKIGCSNVVVAISAQRGRLFCVTVIQETNNWTANIGVMTNNPITWDLK